MRHALRDSMWHIFYFLLLTLACEIGEWAFIQRLVDPYIGTSLILNLCQVGELIGGSQREERLEILEARLDDFELNKDSYWWYLDLRRYGSGQ